LSSAQVEKIGLYFLHPPFANRDEKKKKNNKLINKT